jgi:hypothetical protein
MSERTPVNITLTAKAITQLKAVAKYQLRSRSHAIEILIAAAYQQLHNQKEQTR